mgnify:CR=1 FL=1
MMLPAIVFSSAGKVEREARSARNFLESLRGLESGQFLVVAHPT